MAGKNLSIEIGEHIVKVCCVAQRGKTYQVEKSFCFPTPEDAVNDGVIGKVEELAAEIKSQLERNGLAARKDAVFTISSGRIATREVMLPPVKDNRIQQMVETNAPDYFPVDMTTYQVSYTLLERVGGETPGLRVLVAAAPIQMLEDYAALADACGLRITNMDYSGNSQYQLLHTIAETGVTMYVDLDCTSTVATFVADGVMQLQRTFAYGGVDLINAYVAEHPEKDFITALQELTSGSVSLTEEEVSSNLDRLLGSIVRIGDYYSSTHDAPMDRIVLTGPCARIPHVNELIASGSGEEVVYFSELPDIAKTVNPVADAESCISCIGSVIAPVNLVPASYLSRKRGRGSRVDESSSSLKSSIIICCVCVVAALILCGTAVFGYLGQHNKLQAMEKRIQELSYAEQVYNTYVSYTNYQDGLQVVQDTSKGRNASMESFLSELEAKMPSSIMLMSATCDDTGVYLDVTVNTYEEAATVIHQMRTFKSIDVVSVSSVTMGKSNSGAEQATFTISALYPQVTDAASSGSDTDSADNQTTEKDTTETDPEAAPSSNTTGTEG
jgi:type IV pilus assembly protein PilN